MTEPVDRPDPLRTGPLAPGPGGPIPGGPSQAPATEEASPTFRRLLESLERLARPADPPPEVDDPETLKRALASADGDFQQVMDLRRRLEEAFRQKLP